jgi:hypothetical protein
LADGFALQMRKKGKHESGAPEKLSYTRVEAS